MVLTVTGQSALADRRELDRLDHLLPMRATKEMMQPCIIYLTYNLFGCAQLSAGASLHLWLRSPLLCFPVCMHEQCSSSRRQPLTGQRAADAGKRAADAGQRAHGRIMYACNSPPYQHSSGLFGCPLTSVQLSLPAPALPSFSSR